MQKILVIAENYNAHQFSLLKQQLNTLNINCINFKKYCINRENASKFREDTKNYNEIVILILKDKYICFSTNILYMCFGFYTRNLSWM